MPRRTPYRPYAESLAAELARLRAAPDDNSEIPTAEFSRRLAAAATPFPCAAALAERRPDFSPSAAKDRTL
jgi:hypothetical protein